jgi:hypothetical protein
VTVVATRDTAGVKEQPFTPIATSRRRLISRLDASAWLDRYTSRNDIPGLNVPCLTEMADPPSVRHQP